MRQKRTRHCQVRRDGWQSDLDGRQISNRRLQRPTRVVLGRYCGDRRYVMASGRRRRRRSDLLHDAPAVAQRQRG